MSAVEVPGRGRELLVDLGNLGQTIRPRSSRAGDALGSVEMKPRQTQIRQRSANQKSHSQADDDQAGSNRVNFDPDPNAVTHLAGRRQLGIVRPP